MNGLHQSKCEQVLFVYVFTIIPPRLSDPRNFITVLLSCIHRLLDITISAAATKITRPRRKFALIVLVLVFE